MTQYSSSLNRGLPYLSKSERSVNQIIAKTPSIISELSSYPAVLQGCINKLTSITVFMNTFRTKYCQCLAMISWTSTSNDSQLQSDVNEYENRLKAIQSKIIGSASSALTLVKKASSETGNVYLPPLQTVLERQNRTSDYPSTAWPNVQNCNDLLNRGKFLASKQLQYLQLLPPSNLDCALTTLYWTAINSSRSNSVSLSNAMSAVKSVESNCKNYISLLITSFVRLSIMLSNVNSIGDTFCSCGSGGSATTLSASTSILSTSTSTTVAPFTSTSTTTVSPSTSTSTTVPPTTTTEAPCGEFKLLVGKTPLRIISFRHTSPLGFDFNDCHSRFAWIPLWNLLRWLSSYENLISI